MELAECGIKDSTIKYPSRVDTISPTQPVSRNRLRVPTYDAQRLMTHGISRNFDMWCWMLG
jgi:hypothetical protein